MRTQAIKLDLGVCLTVAEVAEVLRVSKMTVYRLVQSGSLGAARIGESFRIPGTALAQYLDQASPARANL